MAGFTLERLNAGRGGGAAKRGYTLESLNAERSQYREDFDTRLKNYRDAEPVYRDGKPAYKSRNEAFKEIARQVLDTAGTTAYKEFRDAALATLKSDARNAVLRKKYDKLVTAEYDRLGDKKVKSAYLKKALADRAKYKVNEFDELLRHYDDSIKVEDKGADFAFDRGVDPRTIVTSSGNANGMVSGRRPVDLDFLGGPQAEDAASKSRSSAPKFGDGVSEAEIAAVAKGRRRKVVLDPMGLVTDSKGSYVEELDGTRRKVTDADLAEIQGVNKMVDYDPDRGYTGS